jgi:hypothetical protein
VSDFKTDVQSACRHVDVFTKDEEEEGCRAVRGVNATSGCETEGAITFGHRLRSSISGSIIHLVLDSHRDVLDDIKHQPFNTIRAIIGASFNRTDCTAGRRVKNARIRFDAYCRSIIDWRIKPTRTRVR